MTPNKSKRKGSNWEAQFVDLLEEDTGGTVKRIAGSGAIGTSLNEPLLQGDVVAIFPGIEKKFRFECKVGYGGSTQITVQRSWLNKIMEEAENSYSIPALACKFSNARKVDGVQYIVILDYDTFVELINKIGDLKEKLDKEEL
jgi:Holliday junction resolvase